MAGTASQVASFLLIEHPGPWGVDALRDAPLPEGLGAELSTRATRSRTKILLVRRPGRGSRDSLGTRVLAAYSHHAEPWLEAGTLERIEEILDLDLDALAQGRSVGLPRDPGPALIVCTHGRHDACCAEQGRPVAAALAEVFPQETWESSHVGGDRFAASMVALPFGLYHGRLDAASARRVARLLRAGEVDLDHLRGRSGLATPLQAAEIGLRRFTNERRLGAVRFVSRRRDGARTDAVFEIEGRQYAVTVLTGRTPDNHQLTCRAARENPAPTQEITEIRYLDGSADSTVMGRE